MTNEKKIELLMDILDCEEELTPETVLSELDEWDSMAKLSLIVMMDDEFEKSLTGAQIKEFKTIQDILDYME